MAKNNNKSLAMDDTGERMVPEFNKGTIVYGEHLARYHSLDSIVKNKTVLDIASGSGYGTALIAKTARKVIGVDVSKEAIDYSKANFGAKNVEYRVGDGVSIPLEDNSVDVVVSFETIEHIEDYQQFMAEIKRVMSPGGVLVLSTPNDEEYSEENHFHIHEFRLNELRQLVSKYYRNQEMYYQVDALYSALLPEKLMDNREWETPLRTYQYAPLAKNKAIYFLVICSDSSIEQVIKGVGVISEHWSELKNHGKDMVFKKHMDDQAAIIRHLENENSHKKESIEVLSGQLAAVRKELDRIRNALPVRILLKGARITKTAKKKINR